MKVKCYHEISTPMDVWDLREQLSQLPQDAKVTFLQRFGGEGITVCWEEER
jgi:hypothetical protein